MIKKTRKTAETDIRLELDRTRTVATAIESGIPFLDHLLGACAHHGNFHLQLQAQGDLEVDLHHTVEDIGLVLGQAIADLYTDLPQMARFGQALIPMDDALAEVAVDLCNRPYCVYRPILPQPTILTFDTALIAEFFTALVGTARITLHLTIRRAQNSHHGLEALFKAFGVALMRAWQPDPTHRAALSTKGTL